MLTVLVVCVTPTALFALLVNAGRISALARRVTRPDSPAPPADLDRLAANLRRLEREYTCSERSGQPLRATRLRAVNLAYDDVLCQSCDAFGIPAPRRPMSSTDRLQVEAELTGRGFRW